MSSVRIVLEFDDYRPGDDDPFSILGGKWLTRDELDEYVKAAMTSAIGLMNKGDVMAISIETGSGESK